MQNRRFAANFGSKNGSESQKWKKMAAKAKNRRHSDYFIEGQTWISNPDLTKIIAKFTIFNEESLCNNRIYLARGLWGISAARALLVCYRRDTRMRFPFLLQIKYELCPPRSYPIIICWYWELAAKITDCIFIKEECQFKNDGTTSFIIGQIPNALTQNGIYHRSDFILSAPYGIEVCHAMPNNSISKISVEPPGMPGWENLP